jgi:GTP-binding protein
VLEYPGDYERITLADIPVLIEGASENRGLGHRFLKHVERCKVLVFLIDMQGTDGRDPVADFRVLRRELKLYLPGLVRKPALIVANKMDEPDAPENLGRFRAKLREPVLPVSCVSEEGFDELRRDLLEAVHSVRRAEEEAAAAGAEGGARA